MKKRLFLAFILTACVFGAFISPSFSAAETSGVSSDSPGCSIGFDPDHILKGEGTTLWWWTENAEWANIDNGIGEAGLPQGSEWITPEKSATYTLSIGRENDTPHTCTVQLEVIEEEQGLAQQVMSVPTGIQQGVNNTMNNTL